MSTIGTVRILNTVKMASYKLLESEKNTHRAPFPQKNNNNKKQQQKLFDFNDSAMRKIPQVELEFLTLTRISDFIIVMRESLLCCLKICCNICNISVQKCFTFYKVLL